jgi:hypothetical protein
MSFTRFKYDKLRVQKELNEQTFTGRYMLNVPGNGSHMPFQEDPHLRLQHWGANLSNNAITIENDLYGLSRKITNDCIDENEYTKHSSRNENISYGNSKSFVHQSRLETPAWEVKGMQQVRNTHLFYDPQAHTSFQFPNNLNTRILEKDSFMVKYDN